MVAQRISRREFSRQSSALALAVAAGAPITARAGANYNVSPINTDKPKSRTFRIALLDSQGRPIAEDHRKRLYAADLEGEPERSKGCGLADGTIELDVTIPRVTFHSTMPVPGFGEIWVEADNEGEGYQTPGATIDFVREAAKTRLADVERVLKSSNAAFSTECIAHREAAAEFLDLAARNIGSKAASHNMSALSHALWAGELAIVEQARHEIASRPPRRDFLFGCNAYHYSGDGAYAHYFQQIMNYATLPFYLREIEPIEGQPEFGRVERILGWCEKNNIRPKGHPLWWNCRPGVPPWLEGADWDRVSKHCERVVARNVGQFRDRIQVWDVINEAHDFANFFHMTQEQEIELSRICCDVTRANDPGALTIVNNCTPFGRYAADGDIQAVPADRPVMTPLTYLKRLLDANIDFDVIGLQVYFPCSDMFAVAKMLDRFLTLGKPVHITELGVFTEGGRREDAGQWHQPWCEKAQADWMEWFYTLVYSKPEIQACSWWDFRDPGFMPSAAVLREDEAPREIYFRLKAIKKAWGLSA